MCCTCQQVFRWAVHPLNAGLFKATQDELQKIWTNNQETITSTEAEKRKAISSALKDTIYTMMDKDSSGYWRKAGLGYPQEHLQIPITQVRNQGEIEIEMVFGEGNGNENPMRVEDEISDDNC